MSYNYLSRKDSLKIILRGVVALVMLIIFDNLGASSSSQGIVGLIYKLGFLISFILMLQLPCGIYELIAGFFREK
ncbi:hypothetical protein CLOTH_05120 [Alkalithermobacter paradoxus]|uniref:Uncharacterized protein n=2 Tax=Alkalithermobacter paradoxus TaxID=29349 RepID=A0A1V4IBC7_9FIRM|nr:hypothetical protein CLOTH_05120 [[Clostridium] thermoalcaliphilum]